MHRAARVVRHPGRRLARSWRLIGAFVLGVLLLDAGWRGVSAGNDLFRAYRELSAASATLDLSGESLPTAAEYREVRFRVTEASARITRAHGRLAYLRPAIRAAGVLPVVGPSARDASRLLEAGTDVAPALQQLLTAAAPLFDRYDRGQELTLPYLRAWEWPDVAGFWPATPSAEESGSRRGCLVLASASMAPALRGLPLLREAATLRPALRAD